MLAEEISLIKQENIELTLWRQTYEPYLQDYREIRSKLRQICSQIEAEEKGYQFNNAGRLLITVKNLINPIEVVQND